MFMVALEFMTPLGFGYVLGCFYARLFSLLLFVI